MIDDNCDNSNNKELRSGAQAEFDASAELGTPREANAGLEFETRAETGARVEPVEQSGPEPRSAPHEQSKTAEQPERDKSRYATREERRGGGWRKGILIYIGIFVGILLLGFAFRAIFMSASDSVGRTPNRPYIARLDVTGTISDSPSVDMFGNISGYDHSWTLARIDDLIYDDDNFGLILFVDSPGGGVYESDELYLKLREYKDSTDRPIYAVMGSMAASGGYYISAAAERIYANRNTWTGSIGVTLGTMIDVSEFLERYGVKTETITSGRNKSMGSNFTPITDEQRDIFQSLIDEAYDQFTGIVAEGRGFDIEYVRQLADGRIYTAAQAIENGLVDDMGDFHKALDDMQQSYDLFFCELATLQYENRSLISRLLGAGAENNLAAILSRVCDMLSRESGDIGAVLKLAEGHMPTPQYLYER
jgi:protease-4